jgi:hypothetical protein
VNPDHEGRKYFNIAEMLQGDEAFKAYNKGMEVLKNDIKTWKEAGMKEEVDHGKSQLASAYASLCELHMSPPHCDAPSAEKTCEKLLKQGLEQDASNLDCL